MANALTNQRPDEPAQAGSLQPRVGLRFVAKCGNRGTWEWEVDNEPRQALDNSGKWFVWASAIRQVKHGSYNRNPGQRVFFLPLPAQPNEKGQR